MRKGSVCRSAVGRRGYLSCDPIEDAEYGASMSVILEAGGARRGRPRLPAARSSSLQPIPPSPLMSPSVFASPQSCRPVATASRTRQRGSDARTRSRAEQRSPVALPAREERPEPQDAAEGDIARRRILGATSEVSAAQRRNRSAPPGMPAPSCATACASSRLPRGPGSPEWSAKYGSQSSRPRSSLR